MLEAANNTPACFEEMFFSTFSRVILGAQGFEVHVGEIMGFARRRLWSYADDFVG